MLYAIRKHFLDGNVRDCFACVDHDQKRYMPSLAASASIGLGAHYEVFDISSSSRSLVARPPTVYNAITLHKRISISQVEQISLEEQPLVKEDIAYDVSDEEREDERTGGFERYHGLPNWRIVCSYRISCLPVHAIDTAMTFR